MSKSYIQIAREEGRDYICLGSGLADHWVCTHCEGASPGEPGETKDAVKHGPNCPLIAVSQ